MTTIIRERGNGFPAAGDYVTGLDGIWRVVSIESTIHTDHPGKGNYAHATVEPADWSDVAEGAEHSATVERPE